MATYKYYVDSPWTDHAVGKEYALTKVVIKEKKNVLTKTGKKGRAVVVTVTGWNGNVTTKHAVCCPPDEYSLERGAKLAMKRVIDNIPQMTKKMRTSLWQGLFMSLGSSY